MNTNTTNPAKTEKVVNIAAYKFTRLTNIEERRDPLRSFCRDLELKGTILLSPEGINLFLAGCPSAIATLIAHLENDAEIGPLTVKESLSDYQPFNRMLVRIKKEIIAFGIEGIDPQNAPAQKITPQELKEWLYEGRPCTLLDVRNEYEVRLGTFQNSVTLPIHHFRNFPETAREIPPQYKNQPVVMFCTGGIRCEKAGPYLAQNGFDQVYQLDGGILKYFEDCGQAHYEGDCFVFDKRTAVDANLQETATTLCYACQNPLTVDQQASPQYVPGESCPYCYEEPSATS
ncbi:MAG: sulfurtransferase [Planctomycetaceae bacterium]|nr:sulfurtransferase [Planctomycetaceae bacterium]